MTDTPVTFSEGFCAMGAIVVRCDACGALVLMSDQERHGDWHRVLQVTLCELEAGRVTGDFEDEALAGGDR